MKCKFWTVVPKLSNDTTCASSSTDRPRSTSTSFAAQLAIENSIKIIANYFSLLLMLNGHTRSRHYSQIKHNKRSTGFHSCAASLQSSDIFEYRQRQSCVNFITSAYGHGLVTDRFPPSQHTDVWFVLKQVVSSTTSVGSPFRIPVTPGLMAHYWEAQGLLIHQRKRPRVRPYSLGENSASRSKPKFLRKIREALEELSQVSNKLDK